MSATQNSDPFSLFQYPVTIDGASVTLDVTAPDLVNGILAGQSSLAEVLSLPSEVSALEPLARLGIAAGIVFDLVDGEVSGQSPPQVAASTALDAMLRSLSALAAAAPCA